MKARIRAAIFRTAVYAGAIAAIAYWIYLARTNPDPAGCVDYGSVCEERADEAILGSLRDQYTSGMIDAAEASR